jgi:hypothetical protein
MLASASAVGVSLEGSGWTSADQATKWGQWPRRKRCRAEHPPDRGPYLNLSQDRGPNPIAAEPYGRRVLSRGGGADHEVTPQAPLTGSGCRGHSYGGFGGGHPHFLLHAHAGSLVSA